MQNEILGQFNEAGKNGLALVQEITAINSNAIKSLVELQFEAVSANVNEGAEKAKLLTSTKDYKELFGTSSEIMTEYGEKIMSYGKKAESILTQTNEEILATIEKSFVAKAPKAKAKAPAKKPAAKKAA